MHSGRATRLTEDIRLVKETFNLNSIHLSSDGIPEGGLDAYSDISKTLSDVIPRSFSSEESAVRG